MKLFDFMGLKNFRVFDDKEGISEGLAAINILTGTNNSGKSTIIKSLQMLKNSIAGNKMPFDLDLTEQQHHLGDFKNVLSNPTNRNIEITLPFPFLGITTIYAVLSFEIPKKGDSYRAYLRKIVIIDKEDEKVFFSFAYRKATKNEAAAVSKEYEDKKKLQEEKNKELKKKHPEKKFFLPLDYFPPHSDLEGYVVWKINAKKLKHYLDELLPFYKDYFNYRDKEAFIEHYDSASAQTFLAASILVKALKNENLTESWSDFTANKLKGKKVLNGKYPVYMHDFDGEDYFIPSYEIEELLYHFSIKILNKNLDWTHISESQEKYSVISECFESCYKELVQKISAINYLSTVKEENSRIYIGTNNSPFTSLLKDFSNLSIDHTFLNKYLEEFEIGKAIHVDYEPKYQTIKVSILSDGMPTRDLVDFGYGMKQLILILMQISILAEKNRKQKEVYHNDYQGLEDYYVPSLLVVEEPETNLHPKWQSLLADMFVEANANFNIQLIIETHSEYLIRKFQTLTAEKKVKNTPIKIFYLRSIQKLVPGRKQLEKTFIEEDGSIDFRIFDGGFFDVSHKLELSLLNIQRDHFISDFEKLKNSNKEDEDKIKELQCKIDSYILKTDLSTYQIAVERSIDVSKLQEHSVIYLTSGQYLLHNTSEHSDYSPVILQYARAVENELCCIFNSVDPDEVWMLGAMNKFLQDLQVGTVSRNRIRNARLGLLRTALNTAFNTPCNLEIGLLDDLRLKRNGAAHPGQIKTKTQAETYIALAYDFLFKWVELKR
jgi:AAA15 family ATPase/GTPase